MTQIKAECHKHLRLVLGPPSKPTHTEHLFVVSFKFIWEYLNSRPRNIPCFYYLGPFSLGDHFFQTKKAEHLP